MTSVDRFDEVFDVLHRRAALLGLLRDGPMSKPDLVDQLGVSRSTVDRAVESLESKGLAVRKSGGVDVTLSGRLLYDTYESFRERGTNIVSAHELLNHIGADAAFDPVVLSDATIVTADEPAPYLPAQEVESLIGDAVRIEGVAESVINFGAAHRLHEAVANENLEYECVYTPGMMSHLENTLADERRKMAETGRYRAFESDQTSFPFDLFVIYHPAETHVVVVVYDEDRVFKGIVRTQNDDAVGWGESVVTAYRTAATDVTDRFLE